MHVVELASQSESPSSGGPSTRTSDADDWTLPSEMNVGERRGRWSLGWTICPMGLS
jgi:hypothetical protein